MIWTKRRRNRSQTWNRCGNKAITSNIKWSTKGKNVCFCFCFYVLFIWEPRKATSMCRISQSLARTFFNHVFLSSFDCHIFIQLFQSTRCYLWKTLSSFFLSHTLTCNKKYEFSPFHSHVRSINDSQRFHSSSSSEIIFSIRSVFPTLSSLSFSPSPLSYPSTLLFSLRTYRKLT